MTLSLLPLFMCPVPEEAAVPAAPQLSEIIIAETETPQIQQAIFFTTEGGLMNFGAMKRMTRSFLADYSAEADYIPQYSNEWIELCINQAALQVAKETLSLRTHKDQPTVIGQQQYPLPDEFLSLVSVDVHLSNSRHERLERISPDEFEEFQYNNASYQSEPQVFKVEFGATALDNPAPGDIWLAPTPNGEWTLRTTFFQAPTEMTADADISELNAALHKAVCYQAVVDISRQFDDSVRVREFTALYDREMAANETLIHEQDRVGAKFSKNPYKKNRGGRRGGGLPPWDTTKVTGS